MKKLLIAIIILAGIVAALFGYAAYNANSLIAKFKPDLEKIAADTLGAPVTIGNISTSLFPGVEAVIDELKVGGSGSASERFLLKNLSLHLRLLPLLGGTLEISKLSIKGPALTVVHDKEGMRVPGVPKSKGIPPTSKTNATAATSSPLAIRIEELEISDATLSYSDQISGKNYSISDLSLSSHIELGSTITIRNVAVEGRALSSGAFSATLPELTFNPASGELLAPNLAFALLGNPMVISAHGNTSSSSGQGDLKSGGISLSSLMPLLAEVAPALKEMRLAGDVVPTLSATYSGSSYGAKGSVTLRNIGIAADPYPISDLSGELLVDATQSAQKITAANPLTLNLGAAPANVKVSATLEAGTLRIDPLTVNIFSGVLDATPVISLGSPLTFSLPFKAAGLDIDKAMSFLASGQPSKLYGTIDTSSGTVSGSVGPSLKESLQGPVSFSISKGGIRGVNLGGAVLKAVNNIPFISGALFGHVHGEYQKALSSENTEFSSLTGSLSLGGGAINLKGVHLTGQLYSIEASGRMSFDSEVDLKATITFSRDFSDALAGSIKEVQKILSADGTLVIPLEIYGQLPKVIVTPNVEKLVEIAGKRLLKDKAGDLLDRALGNRVPGGSKGLGGLLGF